MAEETDKVKFGLLPVDADYQKFELRIIKDLLETRGMTQADLADKIGRDNTSISRIIRSGHTTTRMLEKIAKALGVELHMFMGGNIFGEFEGIKELEKKLEEEVQKYDNYKNLIDTQAKYIKLLEEKLENVNQK